MKRRFCVVSVLFALISATAWGSIIVIGDDARDGYNAFPFGGQVNGTGGRYQQAYAAADFTGLGVMTITSVSFLSGTALNGYFTLAPDRYDIYFSTISAGIDTLSDSNFDSNRGPDNALFTSVYLSGAAPDTLVFNGTPFVYDPSEGNLLMDIVIAPGGHPANGAGYQASYAYSQNANGVFSRYQDFGLVGTPGWGLVTQFAYIGSPTPPPPPPPPRVPEPATFVLAAAGLGLGVLFRRRC